MCKSSDKEIQSKCEVCQEYLCSSCELAHRKSKSSKDHKLTNRKDIIHSMQAEMKKSKKDLQKEIIALEKKAIEVSKSLESIKTKNQSQLSEVNKYVDSIIQGLQNHRYALLDKIQKENDAVVSTLTRSWQLLESHKTKILSKISAMAGLSNSEDLSKLNAVSISLEYRQVECMKLEVSRIVINASSPVTITKGVKWNEPKTTIDVVKANVRPPGMYYMSRLESSHWLLIVIN